jgi:hypothetical protein
MRFKIASSSAVSAFLGAVFGLAGCSGDVAVGSSDTELQTQTNGEPTGDGSSCSWAGTTLRPADACDPVPTPTGYGPYAVGEDFPAPDGCNECSCTERGIMCTVRECAGEGSGDTEPVACTDDAMTCPDGSSVGREGPDCHFAPCPSEEGTVCTLDAMICPDGSSVGREGPECEFAPCPGAADAPDNVTSDDCTVVCTKDAQICPDGSSVSRVGPDCAFEQCPDEEPVACTDDAMECPDGSFVGRVAPDCEFAPCPDEEPGACDGDAMACPDGSFVGRVGPDCEFAECPDEEPVACTDDLMECPDGSFVARIAPDCEFGPCTYEPCEGKTCGDTCTLCSPNDPECGETAVVKFCSEDGICDAAEPACL